MAETIKTILVEDEPKALKILQSLLSSYGDIQIIASVQDPDKAVESIIENKPDLVFLDIQLPRKNGFQVLDEINQLTVPPPLIFTTAYDSYAIKAIRYSAFDYLLKPIDKGELLKAITRFKTNRRKNNSFHTNTNPEQNEEIDNKIKFNSCEGIVFYNTKEILYAEAQRNYSILYLTNNRKQYLAMNLGKVEEKFKFPPFYRISRSVIINTMFLQKIDKKKKLCELFYNGDGCSLSIPNKKITELNNLL